MAKRWAYCFTDLPADRLLIPALEQDEVCGRDTEPGWHRSRGKLRTIASDPRWRWLWHYEFLIGLATNDKALADRFLECVRKTEGVKVRKPT